MKFPTTLLTSSWLPIMKNYEARQSSYFATPAVQLIGALRLGLEQMHATPGGMEGFLKAHCYMKTHIHTELDKMGLTLLTANIHIASNLLSTVRYPKGKGAADRIPAMKKRGLIIAAGLHPECASEYFRFGRVLGDHQAPIHYSASSGPPRGLQSLRRGAEDEVCKA